MVEHASVILMVLDRDGIFTLYTGAGLQAIGRKPGELVGQSLLELYAGYPTIIETFHQALAGHIGTTTMEAGELQFEVQWAPTRDRQGEINGVISVAVDVTARGRALREAQRAHEAAARLSQARSDFLAAVSHELRTPLTAVVGYAELLLSRWDRTDEGKRRAQVARIVIAATRQQRMVEDLLLLNQVENNALNLACEPLEVGPLVQRAVEAVYPGQHISIHGPTLRVIGDGDRLPQVVANLLDNAAKSSPRGGTIAVTWEDDRDSAILRVHDQGPGIPEEWHEYIFTRFGRVPGSRNRAGRGRHPVHGAEEVQVGGRGHLLVESRYIGDQPDARPDRRRIAPRVEARHGGRSRGGGQEAGQHPYGDGFAGPARTKERRHRAGGDAQTDPVNRREIAESAPQAEGFNHGGLSFPAH